MRQEDVTLVVGADGLIGRALVDLLLLTRKPVIGTTRRPDTITEKRMFHDLSKDISRWNPPCDISVAYICAGVSSIEHCQKYATQSAIVNIYNTVELAKKLVKSGTFIIFPSTNLVYDGSVPFRKANDPACPLTEYGRQKAEAERQLLSLGKSISVVRFTKILGSKMPLFEGWVRALKNDEAIHLFSDMVMAPVLLNCVMSILRIVADLRLPGILQVSGKKDISYEEAACIGARLLGFDVDLVKPITVMESRNYMEPVPANTTLNIDCLKHRLGIVPPDVRWTIKQAFKSL